MSIDDDEIIDDYMKEGKIDDIIPDEQTRNEQSLD